jgi:hypothetical protein
MNAMTEAAAGLAAGEEKRRSARSQTDWERVEVDYRAGILTLREIGKKVGVSHQAITQKAKREGWDRDLHARIKARAEALVAKRALAAANLPAKVSRVGKATERATVEAAAEELSHVLSGRKAMVERLRATAVKLASEMEGMGANPPILAALRSLAEKIEDVGVRRDALMQINELELVSTLETRISLFAKLMSGAGSLFSIEADAYGLSKEAPAGSVPSGLSLFYPDIEPPTP